MESEGIKDFVTRRFPEYTSEVISDTNNLVFRISNGKENFVVKEVTDADVPICYTVELNNKLEKGLHVQQIYEMHYHKDSPSIILSEYIPGISLAEIIQSLERDEDISQIARYLVAYGNACDDLPRLRSGFGLYKVDAPCFDELAAFLLFYAQKYWSRVKPVLPVNPYIDWVDLWLESGFRTIFADSKPVTAPVDSNLKNFIVGSGGDITLLNIPIVGLSTRAHTIAALSVHLRYSALFDTYRGLALETFSRKEAISTLHLELWQVLGLMSFYAARNPAEAHSWTNWGSSTRLIDHFGDLIEEIKKLSAI